MEPRALNLRELRKQAGLTLAQLADATHFSLDYVWRIETGRAALSSEAQMRFAELFAPQPLRVGWNGRVWRVTPDGDAPSDCPDDGRRRRRVPSDGMTLGEKIVRVSKEGRELLAKAVMVNKYIVMLHRNPEAAAEFGGEITKELADVLAWGQDLMGSLHETFDAAYHEAEEVSARELAAECGMEVIPA